MTLYDCVYTVDMDATLTDEMESSASVQTEVHGSKDDDSLQPPYQHVDQVTTRPQTDSTAAGERQGPGAVSQMPAETLSSSPHGQAEQRQQPRSTTKCRVIPIVVSGQSTARLGQLCYETSENSDQSP